MIPAEDLSLDFCILSLKSSDKYVLLESVFYYFCGYLVMVQLLSNVFVHLTKGVWFSVC